MKYLSSVLLLLLCAPLAVLSATRLVPSQYSTIQSGIDAAEDGDSVLVADGTYSGEGNIDIYFFGKAITVLSENGAEYCTIDCDSAGRAFIFNNSEDTMSVVQGFTITGGLNCYGGAIYCFSASPKIVDCIFYDNRSPGT